MDQIARQLHNHIHDEKHFSARCLSSISSTVGLQRDVTAKLIVGVYAMLLVFSAHARFMANLVLVGYPSLISHFFVEERASRDHLLIYWTFFGWLTIFDDCLDELPLYYLTKVLMLSSLFLDAFNLLPLISSTLNSLRLLVRRPQNSVFKPWELEVLNERHTDRPEKPEQQPVYHSEREETVGSSTMNTTQWNQTTVQDESSTTKSVFMRTPSPAVFKEPKTVPRSSFSTSIASTESSFASRV